MATSVLTKAVSRFINGDNSAFDEIYDNTYKVVFFVAHSILHNRAQSENIVQDTYINFFSKINEYKDQNALAYLTTIAKNLAINQYNRNKREVLTDFEVDYLGIAAKEKDDEAIGIIRLAEDSLPEQDFLIVVMYAVAGYNRREISQILGIPISTVSYKYTSAIKILEAKMKKEDDYEKN